MRHRTRVAIAAASMLATIAAAPAAAQTPTPPPPLPAPVEPPVAAVPVPCRAPSTASPAPPSARLLGAFGILRRPATPADRLPREALAALRRRGFDPVDPASARLLRTTPQGGRAWVVPVPDVGRFGLAVPCRVPRKTPLPAPAEGLAVVALGGAPAGGGGAVADLVRGRAPVAVDACAGPDRDMLAVSGVVPDGVGAAFLTNPDGSAVRADVRDNGYAFVVPRTHSLQPRYVVWTGGDGTPHVQPVPFVPGLGRLGCARRPASVAEITPGFGLGCIELVTRPRRRSPRPALRCVSPLPIPALPVPAPAPRPRTP
jgi:hypothetical protein